MNIINNNNDNDNNIISRPFRNIRINRRVLVCTVSVGDGLSSSSMRIFNSM